MKKLFLLLVLPFFVQCNQSGNASKPTSPFTEENSSVNDKAKQDAKAKLEGYRQRVLKGESMATLAEQYSEDPGSAKNGGRYDGIVPGQMVKEFEDAAFALKAPGDVSEVFETQYGFHFIQLVARNGASLDVRHILVIPK